MRLLVTGLVLAAVAAMPFACSSGQGAKNGTQASSAAGATSLVMHANRRDVLRLTVPVDTVCTAVDGSLHMKSQDRYVDVWLVRGARTVDEGVGRAGQQITPEFKDFKATSTTALTVAGAPATRLMGSGAEADDGDPGTADLIVFSVGEYVFVACTHGETLAPAAQQWMLTVVQTAQAP